MKNAALGRNDCFIRLPSLAYNASILVIKIQYCDEYEVLSFCGFFHSVHLFIVHNHIYHNDPPHYSCSHLLKQSKINVPTSIFHKPLGTTWPRACHVKHPERILKLEHKALFLLRLQPTGRALPTEAE